MNANFEVRCDLDVGIVRCTFGGFLTDSESRDVVGQVTNAMLAVRRRHGRVLSFFDSRPAAVFSADTIAALTELRSMYQPQDRTAVLVATGLRKFQATRNASDYTRIFLSEEEAMNWLRNGDDAPGRQ